MAAAGEGLQDGASDEADVGTHWEGGRMSEWYRDGRERER